MMVDYADEPVANETIDEPVPDSSRTREYNIIYLNSAIIHICCVVCLSYDMSICLSLTPEKLVILNNECPPAPSII